MKDAIVPFRETDLASEVDRLRKELARLQGDGPYPAYRIHISHENIVGCRMCGSYEKRLTSKGIFFHGPSTKHEPAYQPFWLARLFGAKPHAQRMRRYCEVCKAVYYERCGSDP